MDKIGVGILSTNRLSCLKRLYESIEEHTKRFDSLDIFISDDSSIEREFKKIDDYIAQKKSCKEFRHVGERVGVARNSNLLLKQLEGYKYKLLFNNDIEILKKDWETIYFEAMRKSGLHSFCFRQLGLWGACKEGERGKSNIRPDKRTKINDVEIATIFEKPHGAILALDDKVSEVVGYFDERFGSYGMEHHDFFFRISESGIQPKGIHDLCASNEYFKIHNEESCLDHSTKASCYQRSKEIYAAKMMEEKKEIYIGFKKQ